MNVLKRKLMLSFLGKEPSPSRFEVCDRMRPYLRQYGLRLTGEGILFPEKWSDSQYLLWLIYACPLYRREIPFGAVVRLLETPGGLHLMLRTGHVFYFAAGGSVWNITDVYRYGEPSLLTLRWWQLSGWIAGRYKRLHRRRT
ncbi:MAG: hypothetical protein ACLSC9_11975 [Barnesiella sp.]